MGSETELLLLSTLALRLSVQNQKEEEARKRSGGVFQLIYKKCGCCFSPQC